MGTSQRRTKAFKVEGVSVFPKVNWLGPKVSVCNFMAVPLAPSQNKIKPIIIIVVNTALTKFLFFDIKARLIQKKNKNCR
jgi:hypothetical protein